MTLAALAFAAPAAVLDVISVDATNVACMLSTNCSVSASDSTDEIELPNSSGEGFLQTRVIRGQRGSAGEGLYAYLYRIDLTGITPDNPDLQGCFTNVVRCSTNRVRVETNRVVCVTNTTPATNRLICVTNRIPATNVVICFTNELPATNFVRCITNSAGVQFCFTNFIPATNFVSCFTVRVPATNIINCDTISFPATTNVVCTTNRVRYTTNVVECVTNTVPCPGATPCVESLRIKFGPSVSFSAPGSNGSSTGRVFVITSGEVGTVPITGAALTGSVVTLQFSNTICPGSSSLFIGLVSSSRPDDVEAIVRLTSGKNREVDAVAPDFDEDAILCDFGALRTAIQQLGPDDLLAPNDNSREGRRRSLLNAIDEAIKEAHDGDADDALDELEHVIDKTEGDNNWLSAQAATQLRALLDPLLECLGIYDGDDDDDDDDED